MSHDNPKVVISTVEWTDCWVELEPEVDSFLSLGGERVIEAAAPHSVRITETLHNGVVQSVMLSYAEIDELTKWRASHVR